MTIDRLFVIWSAPSSGARHVVGHLARGGGEHRFWYEADLNAASGQGFGLLPGFAEHRTEAAPYVARYLFAAFAERIPSPTRPDARTMLTRWGVERPDDPFEILARSAGIRATDRIELAEYRSADDGLVTPLEFRVAGARHVPEHRRAELKPGVRVELRRERDNPVDANATIVVAIGGQQAGWVPRQYSELFARNLDGGAILRGDVVRQLLIPDEDGRWVVRAGREP